MRIEWGTWSTVSAGLERGVLYFDNVGIPWSGLLSLTERNTSSITTEQYIDGIRRASIEESGDFEGTLEAFTYPDEFDGLGVTPTYRRFGLSYRTGTRLHLVYNAYVQPKDPVWKTNTQLQEPETMAWDIYGAAMPIPGARPAAHLVIDADGYFDLVQQVEDMLYGTDTTDARLPDPIEVIDLFESVLTLRIRDNGDGSWTAIGPDDWISINADGSFSVTAPSAQPIDDGKFVIRSY